jgi:RNA polymerase sigma factor (sigma-70 family)
MQTETGQPDSRSLTSESLLKRVRDWRDGASWETFFRIYHRVVLSFASKAGLNPEDAKEVAQDTMIEVAARMRDFHYNRTAGSFKSWVCCQARARIKEHWERRATEQKHLRALRSSDDSQRTATVERLPDAQTDPVLLLDRTWDEVIMETALARVRTSVPPKQFQIFDLYTVKAWPARRVGSMLGVSVAQVYLVKSRISYLIKRETRRVRARMERPPAPGRSFRENHNQPAH